MRIERVEALDRRKSKVFTDGDFAFLLYNGELEKYGIYEGAILEQGNFRQIEELLKGRARERAYNLLKVQDRTEEEIRRRLLQDGYPGQVVQETMRFLQEYRLIDDARYALNYLQLHGKRKSRAELAFYLQRKGIPREVVRSQMETSGQDSGEAIRALLRKKHYIAGQTPRDQKNKIVAYLMRRGFSWEDIRREMDCMDDGSGELPLK